MFFVKMIGESGKDTVSPLYTIRVQGLTELDFNFIQQKSPTSVSGEMNAYWYSIPPAE
ncbi:hypothetical protein J6TS1_14150 [Siminovitchia terrae]|uniref:Uncharacterized protein n=1 Tax=Siminovitchia terrae TaxID=1914933 RepID=A0ABQ4KU24_SIMTE|nr:hypothetical protein J6TS1_14150 [Siminovitchia terrae]